MQFTYNGKTYRTHGDWVEDNLIMVYSEGKQHRRKVYFNRTDGLYIKIDNMKLFYSDFEPC